MAESEAQRRANLNYKKRHTKSITLTFFPSDMALYDYVSSKGSKAGYIKRLIIDDMAKNQLDPFANNGVDSNEVG